MPYHASLTANLPSLSLASLFQAAAGRAWARTRPTRAYHRTCVRSEGVTSSILHTVRGGHDDSTGLGGPSSSSSSVPYAVPPSSQGSHLCATPPSPPPSTSPPPSSEAKDASYAVGVNTAQGHSASAFPRLPRQDLVTYIDVERLLPQDFETSGSHDTGPPSYESDPPWEELRDSVPGPLLPRILLLRSPVPKQLSMIPDPSTSEDLLKNLTLAMTARPPATLSQLLSYHETHLHLHSTASFNLLIKLAIRNASFGTVKDLFSRMALEGIPVNVETRTLRARWLIRTGRWDKAWEREMAYKDKDGLPVPLPVWMEFFGDVKRGAIQVYTAKPGLSEDVTVKSLPPSDPSVVAERVNLLLKQPPFMSPADLDRVPPHAVYVIVRALIALDQRSAAAQLTSDYFKALPQELNEEWRRSCLSIIHLHLNPGRRCNLSQHFAMSKTLFGFLGMHPSFQPTSTTLLFLLASLRWTRKCGKRADAVVRSFVKRWGPDIVDDAVRRRLASFWLKQQKVDRARAVLETQDAIEEERIGWQAEKEAVVGDSSKDRARRLRWLDLHRSPRKSKARWNWRLLRTRLQKAQVRRS
ncbi:hypothetical protein GY45DRAFT_1247691 [Cubamyces sp. BRFM 1775]|nr:hypothetical protein GY45DRAFT_1247691 [Cubamyces sp. BRFM 1775]